MKTTKTTAADRDTRAKQMYQTLCQNADDFYADRITYEEYGKRNGAAWDVIKAAGLTDDVLALWRAANPLRG